jgi:hypothetical protein
LVGARHAQIRRSWGSDGPGGRASSADSCRGIGLQRRRDGPVGRSRGCSHRIRTRPRNQQTQQSNMYRSHGCPPSVAIIEGMPSKLTPHVGAGALYASEKRHLRDDGHSRGCRRSGSSSPLQAAWPRGQQRKSARVEGHPSSGAPWRHHPIDQESVPLAHGNLTFPASVRSILPP